jgi:hypothetical protein
MTTTKWNTEERRMSGFGECRNSASIQGISSTNPGQNYPQHYPQPQEYGTDMLGAPLGIREVARLIGCSAWTVRQQYVPRGLPHLRSGPQGKLIFYRDQVVRWIVAQQTKGGNCK